MRDKKHNNIMEVKALSKKQKVMRSLLVFLITVLIVGAIYLILVLTGWWESINSVEKLKNFILSLVFWGRLVYVILQFLQVTFIPLPAAVLIIAGSLVYGPNQAALLSLAGILLGSAVAFFLGRVFGKKIVRFMVGKETCNKWVKFLSHGKYSFIIMMLFPFFPDDVLCLVAGVTDMSWTFFMVTQFLTRPVGIYVTAYLGSGEVIPFHGWGLAVWGVIIALAMVGIFLSVKYKDKIEATVRKVFQKKH